MTRRRTPTLTALAAALILLAGCGATSDPAPSPDASTSSAATTDAATADATTALLSPYGLDGLDAVELIDRMDRLGGSDRPSDLMASVRADHLLLAADGEEITVPTPADRFYLSLAPYVSQTHDCYFHSLTTCQGELSDADVHVLIVDDATGETLVDEDTTTYANGFVAYWLPRDIEATLTVTHDGRTGQTAVATDAESPTCLTTLQLA
ncbi:MAG: CueP family metal-binding protein [Cellulomonadaceae bacterium]